MSRMIKKVITTLCTVICMSCIVGISVKAESMEIIKANGVSIKKGQEEVTRIEPDEFNEKRKGWKEYQVELPKVGYGEDAYVAIPVEVKERGYLAFEMTGVSVNNQVKGTISTKSTPGPTTYHGVLETFFTIGNFLDSDTYNVERGAAIFDPGIYYVIFTTSGTNTSQVFNFSLTYTKADQKQLQKTPITGAGLDALPVYYKVVVEKDCILKVNYTGCDKEYGYTNSYGKITLCDSKKKQIGESVSVTDKKSVFFGVKKGTYYVRFNVEDAVYTVSKEEIPYLKTPKVSAIKAKDNKIIGTADKNVTVNIATKYLTHTGKTNSKGQFSIPISLISKGDKVTIYTINTKGQFSKTVTIKVK